MRVLYQIPSLDTIYAGRTIYFGYKNAFEDLGHHFKPLTANDSPEDVLNDFHPDILITSLSNYHLKFLSAELITKYRKTGMKVFVNLPMWNSFMNKTRINEDVSLSKNKTHIQLIRSGNYGDVFYNVCEQGAKEMEGFEKKTGYKYHTIPLAADKVSLKPRKTKKFKAEISFIGSYLPQKKEIFNEYLFPLQKNYSLKLYGQDWTVSDRLLGWPQRIGQYFNLPILSSIRKPKLKLRDEAEIYASSTISVNLHEDYQRKLGAHCNERTFKIPFCDGFEITDNIACIRKYFVEDKEIVIASTKADWFDKIDFYIRNPDKRADIIKAGKAKVLKEHTYHNRVNYMINILKTLSP